LHMTDAITPRERVMIALHGGRSDKVPFTLYENKLPQCTVERELRNRGLCVVCRMSSYREVMPDVRVTSHSWTDDKGRDFVRNTFSTPVGDLDELTSAAGFTSWTHEHLFKSTDDYKALSFMIKNRILVPEHQLAAKKVMDLGPDFIVRDQIPLEPLQQIISRYMGTEAFCYEWMDNRDEVLGLYDALVEHNRKTYAIVAEGPLDFANYGGNVTPSIIGTDVFRKYYVPNYQEAAEVLRKKGKLIGVHLDADNTTIMGDIAATSLDYIEAYDAGSSPPVKEARHAFPGKVLWINWPSAWHLNSLDVVRERTRQIIEEAMPCDGFIIGITEDVPEERWRGNFTAIMDGIDDCRFGET
jgi:hypothetical protein